MKIDPQTQKPIILLAPATRTADGNTGDTGPVSDTLGYSRLAMYLVTGAAAGSYLRYTLQFSADNSTWTTDQATALLFSGGVTAPTVGAKQSIEHGYIDLSPEKRYVRVLVGSTAPAETDDQTQCVMGILSDPVSSEMVTEDPHVTSGWSTRAAAQFNLDAHNRA